MSVKKFNNYFFRAADYFKLGVNIVDMIVVGHLLTVSKITMQFKIQNKV